jgi:hypothetical protein
MLILNPDCVNYLVKSFQRLTASEVESEQGNSNPSRSALSEDLIHYEAVKVLNALRHLAQRLTASKVKTGRSLKP